MEPDGDLGKKQGRYIGTDQVLKRHVGILDTIGYDVKGIDVGSIVNKTEEIFQERHEVMAGETWQADA